MTSCTLVATAGTSFWLRAIAVCLVATAAGEQPPQQASAEPVPNVRECEAFPLPASWQEEGEEEPFCLNDTNLFTVSGLELVPISSIASQFLENVRPFVDIVLGRQCKCGLQNEKGLAGDPPPGQEKPGSPPKEPEKGKGDGEQRLHHTPEDDRIVGGEQTLVNQYPWMAAILVRRSRLRYYVCGGSLVNNYVVLTAAHCVVGFLKRPEYLLVDLGEHDLFSATDTKNEIRDVAEVIVHPKYEGRFTSDYDAAILVLKTPVDIHRNPRIRPVCLPNVHDTRLFVSMPAKVMGWGKLKYGAAEKIPGILYSVNVTVFPDEVCERAYKSKFPVSGLCAGDVDGGKDSCQGDSGGPLVIEVNGRYMQIGIVSFGRNCAEAAYPGVYTRVTSIMDFVMRHFTTVARGVLWCR